MKNRILSIAGSDSCGGAGIQADIKTATTLKTYCATAITCLTAQNSQKVLEISYSSSDFISKQINAVLDDFKIDFIKTGMLGNAEIIFVVAKILKQKPIPFIVDPVMVATSGDLLLKNNCLEILKSELITNCYLTTPNTDEAELLSGIKIKNLSDMKLAAKKIQKIGAKNVLIKGGHLNFGERIQNYLLLENGDEKIISNQKLPFKKIHGTGCTLSTAIICFLSHGFDLKTSVKKANQFVFRAIKNGNNIGLGSRILQHF